MKRVPLLRNRKKRRKSRRQQTRVVQAPTLRFTPHAWAKLLFLRDAGGTEIGGFGIAAGADPLLIEEIALVCHRCSVADVEFDDEAVADHFDRQVDAGLKPVQFARVWLHTHPGDSAEPSGTDEQTFARVFGGCDWSVMAILARGGQTYARLQYGGGPFSAVRIPVEVTYGTEFPGSDHSAWQQQYDQSVTDAGIGHTGGVWPAESIEEELDFLFPAEADTEWETDHDA